MDKDLIIELSTTELVQLIHKAKPGMLWGFTPSDSFETKGVHVSGVLQSITFRFRRTGIDLDLESPDGIEDGKL